MKCYFIHVVTIADETFICQSYIWGHNCYAREWRSFVMSEVLFVWIKTKQKKRELDNSMYSRTCLKQYCWDQGVGIELKRLLN